MLLKEKAMLEKKERIYIEKPKITGPFYIIDGGKFCKRSSNVYEKRDSPKQHNHTWYKGAMLLECRAYPRKGLEEIKKLIRWEMQISFQSHQRLFPFYTSQKELCSKQCLSGFAYRAGVSYCISLSSKRTESLSFLFLESKPWACAQAAQQKNDFLLFKASGYSLPILSIKHATLHYNDYRTNTWDYCSSAVSSGFHGSC